MGRQGWMGDGGGRVAPEAYWPEPARRRAMTAEAFICDYVRTPIGRYAGALASVRADDLAAWPIRELMRRHPGLADKVDEVFLGCANQAGEDNRNLARMALLLAGLPGHRSRRDRQPPVRLGHGRGRGGGAGDQGGRDRARGRRRRRDR